MIFFYLNDTSKLPVYRLKKLCKICNESFKKWAVKTIEYPRTIQIVKIPNINSPKFAEFCGILLGDGCIYSKGYGICISGHKVHDLKYFKDTVSPLYKSLFGLSPRLHFDKKRNSVRCVVYSKKAAEFLAGSVFAIGNKKLAKVSMPEFYFQDKKLLKSCLRGLCDTDGRFCPHPHTKVMFHLTVTIPELFSSTKRAFEELNFPIHSSGCNLYFYGRELTERFFKEIGCSNPKHSIKLEQFFKTGIMPRTSDLDFLLK